MSSATGGPASRLRSRAPSSRTATSPSREGPETEVEGQITAALGDSPDSGPPDVTIADEAKRSAQARMKAHRPVALILARALRQDATRPPVFTLRCYRGCTLLKTWELPEDENVLWWRPSVKRSAHRARQEGHPDEPYTREAAGQLADTVQAAGSGWLDDLATCDHYQARLYSQELVKRVTQAQRQGGGIAYRLGANADADARWVEFVGRPPAAASPS
jgi:hypothetical protein